MTEPKVDPKFIEWWEMDVISPKALVRDDNRQLCWDAWQAALFSQWTPASQPPEKNDWYQVTVKGNNRNFVDVDQYCEKKWAKFGNKNIIAYQPLPAAYQPPLPAEDV